MTESTKDVLNEPYTLVLIKQYLLLFSNWYTVMSRDKKTTIRSASIPLYTVFIYIYIHCIDISWIQVSTSEYLYTSVSYLTRIFYFVHRLTRSAVSDRWGESGQMPQHGRTFGVFTTTLNSTLLWRTTLQDSSCWDKLLLCHAELPRDINAVKCRKHRLPEHAVQISVKVDREPYGEACFGVSSSYVVYHVMEGEAEERPEREYSVEEMAWRIREQPPQFA